MKKLYLLIFLFTLNFSIPSHARLSCDDLDEIAESLDEFAEEFNQLRTRDIDRSVDRALEELVEALNIVAYAEGDKRLSAWIQDLEIAYEDREREDFEESIDDVIERLDDLYDRDCRRR